MDDSLLENFCKLIGDKTGLHFTKDQGKELERKLATIKEAFAFQSLQDCLKWFLEPPFNKKKLDALAESLTIGETYFFRDTHAFEILKKTLLPALIQERKNTQQLWIWSAGCCTGEEIYSLAILLDQLLPSPNTWSIHLIGTDINPEFLRRARQGQYREWSLRSTPEAIKKTYFIKEGDLFTLLPSIREKVEFYVHNLMDPLFPFLNQMDLILCQNVIIYFSPSHLPKVVQRLADALKEEGWLSVSSIETPYILDPSLTPVPLEGVPFFRKKASSSPSPPRQPFLLSPSHPLPSASFPSLQTTPEIFPESPLQEISPPFEKKWTLQILKERAHQLAHAIDRQERRKRSKVLVFYLNKERYAIECAYAKEVHPFKEWTTLPSLPPFIKGVMNIRRKILAVIDLKRFFGLSGEYQSPPSPVIILEKTEKEFAILTDGVEGVLEIFLEEIQPPVATLTEIKQEFLKGLTRDHLLLLDGKKLLEDNRLVIAELRS